MFLVPDNTGAVAAWVAARIPHMYGGDFGPCSAIGVAAADGTALAGVVFCEYRPAWKNIEMACAADNPRWLTRKIINEILNYPFVQLDCVRVNAIVPRGARRTRKFIERLGFRCEGIAKQGMLVDDAAIYGLLRDTWRRSRWRDGQTVTPNPARSSNGVRRPDGLERGYGPHTGHA